MIIILADATLTPRQPQLHSNPPPCASERNGQKAGAAGKQTGDAAFRGSAHSNFLLAWTTRTCQGGKLRLFGFRMFSPSYAHGDSSRNDSSRKYSYWLYLKYVLGNVRLVSRAKTVPMSRGEI